MSELLLVAIFAGATEGTTSTVFVAPSASPTFGGRCTQPHESRRHRRRSPGLGPTSYAMASRSATTTQPARSGRCSRSRDRSPTTAHRALRALHPRRKGISFDALHLTAGRAEPSGKSVISARLARRGEPRTRLRAPRQRRRTVRTPPGGSLGTGGPGGTGTRARRWRQCDPCSVTAS